MTSEIPKSDNVRIVADDGFVINERDASSRLLNDGLGKLKGVPPADFKSPGCSNEHPIMITALEGGAANPTGRTMNVEVRGRITDFVSPFEKPKYPVGSSEGTRVSMNNGRVTEAEAPNGVRVNYAYDANGLPQQIEVTSKDNNGVTLTRGENGQWMRSRWTQYLIGPRIELSRDTVSGVVLEDHHGFSYQDGDVNVFRGHNGYLQETRKQNSNLIVTTIAPDGRQTIQTSANPNTRTRKWG